VRECRVRFAQVKLASLPAAYHLDHIQTNAWAQALAWLIGSALTLAYTCLMWLARGRTAQPQPAQPGLLSANRYELRPVITTGADVMDKIFTASHRSVRDSQLISALIIDIIYLDER